MNCPGRSGHGRDRRSGHLHSALVLPPWSDIQYLDYNDILDILGDYTKAFMDLIRPELTASLRKRGLATTPINELEQGILSQIAQVAWEWVFNICVCMSVCVSPRITRLV